MVEPGSFDQPYSDIVSACIEYRRQYGEAPGTSHIDDLFSDILHDKDHKQHRQYERTILYMLEAFKGGKINTRFLLDQIANFTRLRQLRSSIAEAAARYQKGGQNTVEDIERIFRDNLKATSHMRDYGWTLGDPEALGFLDRDDHDFCRLGIPELDLTGCCPTRQEMLAFLAPRNKGKSQFLGHCGKAGILKGWVVAHYTLENSDDMTSQRYYQNLFNGVRRDGSYSYGEFHDDGETVIVEHVTIKPNFYVNQQDEARKYLRKQLDKDKGLNREKLKNLRIRRFPTGQLSYEMLERDLDELSVVHRFVPDMVMIDYPQIMKLGKHEKDYAALDELAIKLRGLAVERNLAMVVPQQGNRASESVRNVQSYHGGGTMGIAAVADNMITYSQTPEEESRGCARLYTQKVRNDSARKTVMITQHYPTGQFCMDSRLMTKKVQDAVDEYVKGAEVKRDDEVDYDDNEPEQLRDRSGFTKPLTRHRSLKNGDARND